MQYYQYHSLKRICTFTYKDKNRFVIKKLIILNYSYAQRPYSHILMMGGPKDLCRFEIFGEKEFFSTIKNAGIFLGCKKNSNILFSLILINNNISVIYCLCCIMGYF